VEAKVTMRHFEDAVRKVKNQREMKPGTKSGHVQYG